MTQYPIYSNGWLGKILVLGGQINSFDLKILCMFRCSKSILNCIFEQSHLFYSWQLLWDIYEANHVFWFFFSFLLEQCCGKIRLPLRLRLCFEYVWGYTKASPRSVCLFCLFFCSGSVVVGCLYKDLHELLLTKQSIGNETHNSR